MNRIISFISLLLLMVPVFGQTAQYESTLALFQQHYNENDGGAIFEMMDPLMQESVSLKTITSIVNDYSENFGRLEGYQFQKREDIVETYELTFERGKQLMIVAVNSEEKLIGLLFKPTATTRAAHFDRNSTRLQLPFKGEWFTFWGGDNKRQNYHVAYTPQQGAFDFVVLDENDRSYQRSGTRNEDYYAFGKPLYAVCDAEVVKVVTGVIDNRPTQMNPNQAFGNYVVLKTDRDEYIFYAHFQYESIAVSEGQQVKQGQYLGNCGNSGNSSEAHLHLHIQDGPNALNDIGVRCYFESVLVNGTLQTDYSPVKGDRISMPTQ
ncbi:MAG: peptidoglycan DD-metalloendopeptidase family protein [Bacteroidota bacterium]